MDDRRDRWLRRGGLAHFLACAALVVAALRLDAGTGPDAALDRGLVWSGSVIALTGLLLVWARPRNAVGWLLQATALCGAACNAGQVYGERALVVGDLDLPAATAVTALTAPLWLPALFLPCTLLLVRYPSGRLHTAWARRLHAGAASGLAMVLAGYAGSEQAVHDVSERHGNPLLLPGPVLVVLFGGGALLFLPSLVGIVVHTVVRMLRARPPERQQLALLLATAVVAAVVVWAEVPVAGSVAYPAIPVAVVVGVLRYDLLGIEVVVRRTLLYVALTGLVLAVFVAVTAALTTLMPHGRTPAVVAASLVAVGLGPARERLQRLVDRLVYGDRAAPLQALQRLGTPVGGEPAEALLPAVAEALGASLRVPGVAVLRPDGTTAAATGETGPGAHPVPLRLGGADVGTLAVLPRRGEDRLDGADRRLLDAVAPLVAVVLHAVDLTQALAAERTRVVGAAEAERSRLRRDLHDGLGPSLTGVGMGLEALQTRTGADPLVARLREEVRAAVEEVRRILDDLRPAALDEVGLVGALERRAAQLARAGLVVTVAGPDRAVDVPPQVEAAAYRIADEALSNVVRHARASRCTVDVRCDGATLLVEVRDDGTGVPAQRDGGVGLPSMRARAEQLGGRFEAAQTGAGTRVSVALPVREEVPA